MEGLWLMTICVSVCWSSSLPFLRAFPWLQDFYLGSLFLSPRSQIIFSSLFLLLSRQPGHSVLFTKPPCLLASTILALSKLKTLFSTLTWKNDTFKLLVKLQGKKKSFHTECQPPSYLYTRKHTPQLTVEGIQKSFYWTFGRGWAMGYCSQVITRNITACHPDQFSATLDPSRGIQEYCSFAWQKLLLASVSKDGRKMLSVHLLVKRSTISPISDPRENFCTWQSSLSNLSLEWDLRLTGLL